MIKSHFRKDLQQRPLTFLASGTGFVEDNFSTDGAGDGSGVNASYEGDGGNASDVGED